MISSAAETIATANPNLDTECGSAKKHQAFSDPELVHKMHSHLHMIRQAACAQTVGVDDLFVVVEALHIHIYSVVNAQIINHSQVKSTLCYAVYAKSKKNPGVPLMSSVCLMRYDYIVLGVDFPLLPWSSCLQMNSSRACRKMHNLFDSA